MDPCTLVERSAVDISGSSSRCICARPEIVASELLLLPPGLPEGDWGKVFHSLLVIHLFVLTNFISHVMILLSSGAVSYTNI